MLYVLIVFCSGFCPGNLPPPNGALMFTSLHDCREVRDSLPKDHHPLDENGQPMKKTFQKITCATMYADQKQLARLFPLPAAPK